MHPFCHKIAFATLMLSPHQSPLPFTHRSSKSLMWPLALISLTSFSSKVYSRPEQLRLKLSSDNFWYKQSASYTHMTYRSCFPLFFARILCKVFYYILNLFTDLISCIFLPRQRSDRKFGDHHPVDLLSASSATCPLLHLHHA